MRRRAQSRNAANDAGIALLIAIFALLLISVVAIALIVSTGTDSALARNYRTASGAYYAAIAGLEEARGRLLWKNPDFINNAGSYTNLLFDGNGVLPQWPLTQVVYIVNPGPAGDPNSILTNYPDTEFAQEFPSIAGSAIIQQFTSATNVSGIPGPSYKWARINPVTEQSLNLDVNGDGVLDGAGVLYYDPANVNALYKPAPGLVVSSPGSPPTPPTTTAVQALEITSLAVMPDGSKRLLQYLVAPMVVLPTSSINPAGVPPQTLAQDLNFPAALALLGPSPSFTAPGDSNFFISGRDGVNGLGQHHCPSSNLTYSIGYTDNSATIHEAPAANYPGAPGTGGPPPTPSNSSNALINVPPSSSPPLMNPSWLSPVSLDTMLQQITQSADVVINGNAVGNDILAAAPLMGPGNPAVVVVNGDLDLNAWHNTGYGLLVVTGTLKYDPDATWKGLLLVIGQGAFVSTRGGQGEIDGAMVIARTRDASNNLLTSLGQASFSQTGSWNNAGKGIYYNSCWIDRALGPVYAPTGAQGPVIYRVLSFHEIPLS